MYGKCIVPCCRRSDYSSYLFFKLPTKPDRRKKWFDAIGIEETSANRTARVCCDHFAENNIIHFINRSHVWEEAIPTLKLTPEEYTEDIPTVNTAPLNSSKESTKVICTIFTSGEAQQYEEYTDGEKTINTPSNKPTKRLLFNDSSTIPDSSPTHSFQQEDVAQTSNSDFNPFIRQESNDVADESDTTFNHSQLEASVLESRSSRSFNFSNTESPQNERFKTCGVQVTPAAIDEDTQIYFEPLKSLSATPIWHISSFKGHESPVRAVPLMSTISRSVQTSPDHETMPSPHNKPENVPITMAFNAIPTTTPITVIVQENLIHESETHVALLKAQQQAIRLKKRLDEKNRRIKAVLQTIRRRNRQLAEVNRTLDSIPKAAEYVRSKVVRKPTKKVIWPRPKEAFAIVPENFQIEVLDPDLPLSGEDNVI